MSDFNYSGCDLFGKYCTIEQKRYGVPNEHFIYKIVGTLKSNGYQDVPLDARVGKSVNHKEVVPVANVICCGVDETTVIKVKLSDIKIKD